MTGMRTQTAMDAPISLAIVAMGGQGGGVLADWVAAAANHAGLIVQVTSVPGVAQRTGATIYYLEMIADRGPGLMPVLALMPAPGDVDIVIASELMEAGRAMVRGLVTPDRTVLIASSQRAYATAEKIVPGDGTADSRAVHAAADYAAKRRIVADFAGIAERHGSVISASLLGALAAAGVLPVSRQHFEQAIRDGGVAASASLSAFGAAFDTVARGTEAATPAGPVKVLPDLPLTASPGALDALLQRIRRDFDPAAQRMIYAGVRRLVDYQDAAYAGEYLDRLAPVAALDVAKARDATLTTEVARHLARAMAYDDVISVADLKTRSARARRVADDVGVDATQHVLQTTEYFHPRMDEVCATLPAWLGLAIEARPRLFRLLDRLVNKGRRVRTDRVGGFLSLYLIAGRKPKRRTTLRHGREMLHISQWLDRVSVAAATNYDLAVELAKSRRLIKGYSDTMSRGHSKYDRVLAGVTSLGTRPDAADWARRLRLAALLDAEGVALDGALKTVATLDGPVAPAKVGTN